MSQKAFKSTMQISVCAALLAFNESNAVCIRRICSTHGVKSEREYSRCEKSRAACAVFAIIRGALLLYFHHALRGCLTQSRFSSRQLQRTHIYMYNRVIVAAFIYVHALVCSLSTYTLIKTNGTGRCTHANNALCF